MNSRTFPHQGPGRAGPPSGDPDLPGGPPRGRPFACGEAAVSPSSSRRLPLPSRALGWTLAGGWSGEECGLGWGARMERGALRGGVRARSLALSRASRRWQQLEVWLWGVEGSKAGPEKTREVGWGKGKGGNWIRRAALLQGPHSEGSWGCCLLGLCCPFRRRGARRALRCWGKEKDMQRCSLLVRRGETRRGIMGY